MYWRFSEENFWRLCGENRIWWGRDGNGIPRLKRFLSDVKQGVVPQTLWRYEEVGHTQDAKKQLLSILSEEATLEVFSTPKPVQLIERILRIALKPHETVLDFFAGSGTTAHAVAKLNAEDGGTRRCILVSSTEATVDEPGKNLCRDVCAERVRRVRGGYRNAKGEWVDGLGGGFAYLRAHRLPLHRLTGRLPHADVWVALCLLHDAPLNAWTAPFAQASGADGELAYLADFADASVSAAQVQIEALIAAGTAPTLYSWAPERAARLWPTLEQRPLPQTLRQRFAR